jgi:hypothetical protein
MSQQNAAYTSASPLLGPTGPQLRWTFGVAAPFPYSPLVGGNNTAYVLSRSRLYALRPDGSVLWAAKASRGAASPALGPDGTIYVPQRNSVVAFTPDGVLKWNVSLPIPNVGAGLTVSTTGQVYSVNDGTLYSISPSGELSWSLAVGCSLSSVSIGPTGTLYCGGREVNQGVVNAIDPLGALLWRYATDSPVDRTPIVSANGTIEAVADRGVVYLLSEAGAPVSSAWQNGVDLGFPASSAALNSAGIFYVGGTELAAVASNGTYLWHHSCYNSTSTTVCTPYGIIQGVNIDVNGTLYVRSVSGNSSSLVALVGKGAFAWSYNLPPGEVLSTGAAMAQNGTMYFGSVCNFCNQGLPSGHFYAIGSPKGLAQVAVSETGLPLGQSWNSTIDGETYFANQAGMTVALTNGTKHTWSVPLIYATIFGTRFSPAVSNGTITPGNSASLAVRYETEYQVQFGEAPFGSGTVSTVGGWFVKLTNVSISATPVSGYRFGTWAANSSLIIPRSPRSAATTILVNGTGGVFANFNPQLKVSASSGGSLMLLYAGNSTTVASGGTFTLYLPVSTKVTLFAQSSQGYALQSWTTNPLTTGYGNLSTVVFPMGGLPATITANFGAIVLTTTTISSSPTTTSTINTTTASSTTKQGLLGLHLTWLDAAAGVALIVLLGVAVYQFRRRRRWVTTSPPS